MGAITFAVVPSPTPGDSRFALDALCVALTKLLDRPVHGINSASYQDLAAELEKNRVDYAWMSPALLVLTNERFQLRPLLSAVRDGTTEYHAVLFVEASVPIRTIEQMRGSTVAWVDPTSASGYLVPRMKLAASGIDPTRLFGKELFLRSHAEVARAVFDGRAEVGATYAYPPLDGQPIRRAGFVHVAPDRKVRILDWSGPIPNDVIAGHGLLPAQKHRELAGAILALAEQDTGRRLLYNAFHADRFETPHRHAMRPLHELLGRARANGLLAHL